MATIWERPEGSGKKKWVATVRRRGYKPRSKSFSRKDLAEAWARKIEVEIEAGTYQDTRRAESMSFGEACKWYRETVLPQLKDPSGKERRTLLRLEASSLGSLAVGRIQPADVLAYLEARAKEIAKSPKKRTGVEIDHNRMRSDTLRLEAARISSIYRALRQRAGMAVLNPVRDGVRPLPGRERAAKISRESLDKLLAAAPPVVRAALELQVETALRPGELVSMEWPMVNLAKRRIILEKTKTDPREVPLTGRAVEILRKRKRGKGRNPQGRVWPWKVETAYSAAVREVAKKTDLDFRAHDGRHAGITQMFQEGMSIPEVGAAAGHKTWQMLKRYTSITTDHLIKRRDEVQEGNGKKGNRREGQPTIGE